MPNKKLNWLLKSRAYKKATNIVGTIINSPEKLMDLTSKAQTKISGNFGEKFSEVKETTSTVIRLIKAYAKGDYREISFESIALIITSVIYLLMPIDVIPDFIIALGLTDDVALLAWTYKSVAEDIEKYLVWEDLQKQDPSILIE